MPAAILGPVAGAVVGGMMSDGGGGQQTATKDPWGPAQKPLQNSLTTGQALETYYQQNPFNPLQQAGYQNLYADLDNFRNVMAPQAMAFNNRMMNTNYQRKPAGTELGGAFTPINASQFLPPEQRQPQSGMGGGVSMGGGMPGMPGVMSQGGMETGYNKPLRVGGPDVDVGYNKPLPVGGGLAGVINDMGGMSGLGAMGSAASMLVGQGGSEMGYNKPMLLSDSGRTKEGTPEAGQNKPMQVTNAGLLSGGEPFGMSVLAPNSMSYGLLNWQELNPFTATNGIPKAPPVDPKTVQQLIQEEMDRRAAAQVDPYYAANGGA